MAAFKKGNKYEHIKTNDKRRIYRRTILKQPVQGFSVELYMETSKVKERFLSDTKNHVATIEKNDGLFRHIHIGKPDSNDRHFNLTTWPGYLCISGDMGTYVFSRTSDMFTFFRGAEISPFYWMEKIQAGAGYNGEKICKEWSQDAFCENVREFVGDRISHLSLSEAKDLWLDIKRNVLSCDDEYESVTAVRDFYSECGFDFTDFWERYRYCRKYTFHYIWCCYAIVFGIKLFDEHCEKTKNEA